MPLYSDLLSFNYLPVFFFIIYTDCKKHSKGHTVAQCMHVQNTLLHAGTVYAHISVRIPDKMV